MISVCKDEENRVIAYIEWRQVGPSGFDKYKGEYVWIHDMWIHENHRNKHTFRELIEKVLKLSSPSKWCYFRRFKYDGRLSKIYNISEFEKYIMKGNKLWVTHQK